jgi:lipocalin
VKKLSYIILALFLIISTVGVTVEKHYCGENYMGAWLYASTNACGMDMAAEKNCCHDNITTYSIESEFQFVSNTAPPTINLIGFITISNKEKQKKIESQFLNSFNCYANLPPPSSEPNIYTKVQSFLL